MKIRFAKIASILRFEASCEKKRQNFCGGVQSDTIFKKRMELPIFKKTLITDTIETTKKLRHFFIPLCLPLMKLSLISFCDCTVKSLM